MNEAMMVAGTDDFKNDCSGILKEYKFVTDSYIAKAYLCGFRRGVNQKSEDNWHKRNEGTWTIKPPLHEEVIISVVDSSGDTPYEYTTSGWTLDGVTWISDNEVCFGDVVAWMEFPKPCKEK